MSDSESYGSAGEAATRGSDDAGLRVDAQGGAFWRRVLYMIGYSFIAYFTLIAIFVVAIVQAIHALTTGHRSDEIQTLARNLTTYLTEVVAFVSWASNDKPFPAGRFPDSRSDASQSPG